ncbi:ZIP family metal transporter [Verminephrobacter eiseniae]|uniref:ZIP family metal transporter n=1 Tax=Verminephrobacter eiseniae TaxID=364317 RepID=UPI002237659E|nr:ZIP family metal transporter [Verminephrobacter eiseniae]MCW5284186.1 ZIP family metal transporter [Verminephrobacter eiseniae]MCW5301893.1 ZIP family metal transporter [Verminephrobacter eiseniae]MCW8182125.1 ZIP family metal transporter [Verminephrobacter eiseniae]MCW8192364.1 ZIP family metal transporter [Verminephrobacter eiseniae]
MNQTPSAFVLIAIALATLATGIGSVWLAALLMRLGLGGRNGSVGPQHLLSLAAGVLLATAFMHLLPEAFEGRAEAHDLFATLLVGLVFFFLLDKAELWHHGHEHGHAVRGTDGHGHAGSDAHAHGHAGRDTGGPGPNEHAHRHDGPRTGGWAVLTGDGVHCFGDGILIASAFMADIRLGVLAAVSVLVHEVPHHMGDLVVLCQTNPSQRIALLKVSLAGAVTVLGGVAGYFLVGQLQDFLPYFLVLASSSFVYVALADLIPQLQKRLTARATLVQIVWLLVGMALVTLVRALADRH